MDKHIVTQKNAAQIKKWFETRGGIAVWSSINLSNPGAGWTTPLHTESGERSLKPTWQAASEPRVITDPAEVLVETVREVKRFRVAVRQSGNGLSLKLTDHASERVRREVDKAGEGAFYEFDYEHQEAVILAPVESQPLLEFFGVPQEV